MKDLLGRSYAIGHYVAYGGRAGSHGYMAVGKVVKVDGSKVSLRPVAQSDHWSGKTRWAEDDERFVGLRLPERAVILNPNFEEVPFE